MARPRTIEIYILNLAANPHPSGVYASLLRRAARFLVKARASDYAKITEPIAAVGHSGDGIYTGRILMWSEIDLRRPWLDLENEDELSASLKNTIRIPNSARPNYRTFNYILSENNHKLYFKSKNEFGDRLGPNTCLAIFSRLLSQELLGFESPEVEVSLVPEKRALDRILSLSNLRTLTIRVDSSECRHCLAGRQKKSI